MNRRTFLSFLSGLPIVGRFATPSAPTLPRHSIFRTGPIATRGFTLPYNFAHPAQELFMSTPKSITYSDPGPESDVAR